MEQGSSSNVFGRHLIELILQIPIYLDQRLDQIELKWEAAGHSMASISQRYSP